MPWPSHLKSRNRFILGVDEKGTEAAVAEASGRVLLRDGVNGPRWTVSPITGGA